LYCSEACWECDADSHYELCTQQGLCSDSQAITATQPVKSGQLLWKERAIRRNRSLKGLYQNARFSLPCAPEELLQQVRGLPIEGGYGLFLNASLIKQASKGNATYAIENKGHYTYLLATAARDIEVGETIALVQ